MADINKSFQLKILADISAYQAEMAKIPGVTEKQAAAAALRMEREMVKAAGATGRAAQAAASGGVKALEQGFGQAKEQAAAVAAGVSKISPELGAVVNSASAAVGVFKAMVSAAGPIGIAIAAAGVAAGLAAKAFVGWNDSLNEAAETAAAVKNEVLKQQLGLAGAVNNAQLAMEANEQAAQARRLTATERYFKTFNDLAEHNAITATIASGTIARFWKEEGEESDRLVARLDVQAKGYTALAFEQRDAAAASKEFLKGEKETADWLQEQADKEAARIAANKKARLDAERKAAAETKRIREQIADDGQAVDEAELDSYRHRLRDEKKARDKAEEDRVQQWYADHKRHVDGTEDDQETVDSKRAAMVDSIDIAQQYASAFTGIASSMFGDSKALQIADATINTAAAVIKALNFPPGPPATIPQAVAAGVMGAAQIAKIASTNVAHSGLSFDPSAGGRQSMAPDETSWKLKKNEGVLTERGVRGIGGYSQVRKLNAGQSQSMGGKFVGITQFKHKMLDATIGPNIARPAAARTEIKAIAQTGGRVGHRLRSNT